MTAILLAGRWFQRLDIAVSGRVTIQPHVDVMVLKQGCNIINNSDACHSKFDLYENSSELQL
jgi:hypothetical protein